MAEAGVVPPDLFDPVARDGTLAALVTRAEADERVGSAALLGSLTTDDHDRWSDLDLSLALAPNVDLVPVLDDWTDYVCGELRGTRLLDLDSGGLLYRVFLLPGWLQLDLSFSQGGTVRQAGPRLKLLFGDASPVPPTPGDPASRAGYGVLWARHGFVCLRRARPWQAAFCLAELRHAVMDLVCLDEGLPARFGRGHDDLPTEWTERLTATVPAGMDQASLAASMRAATLLLAERPEAAAVAADLRRLVAISA